MKDNKVLSPGWLALRCSDTVQKQFSTLEPWVIFRGFAAVRGYERSVQHVEKKPDRLIIQKSEVCGRHMLANHTSGDQVHDPNVSSGLTRDSVPSLHRCGRSVSLRDASAEKTTSFNRCWFISTFGFQAKDGTSKFLEQSGSSLTC